ncbi:glycosyltransferase family 2 protein [Methanobacterium sp.]|uniref:glycosyltransferase family 2 protein n=1 Tax=Methanobacterium sp. TaxID=2164 RepID=UPI003C7717C1
MDSNENYKLSAIVLVYNGGKHLRGCLNSLINQTLEDMEIILVNDVSTDDSLSICKEFAQNFSNIKIINKEENEGLATSGNIGISAAKGEYIILVDNDDIIPPYAYERLYNKAKETNADIVIGKANFLIGHYQYEMESYELSAWKQDRTIKSAKEFPTIYHDSFYWNKIVRRKLISENDIKLPKENEIYADRKFGHLCFINADTISIIPDCIYIWRQRKFNKDLSLSSSRREAWNYIKRINSFKDELEKFTSFDENYFKVLMRRVLIPVSGVLESEEFKEVFFEKAFEILSEEAEKYEDIYDNELDILINLYIYLILHDFREELVKLVELDLDLEEKIDLQKDIIFENGKSYWNLPYFRNSKLKIPDRLFEIKSLRKSFVTFNNLITNEDFIIFDHIEIPKNFPIKKGQVVFTGRTTLDRVLDDNKLLFELKPIDDDDIPSKFTVKIPTKLLSSVEEYDIAFQFEHFNGKLDKFRIAKNNFKDIINKSEYLEGYVTINDKLSFRTLMVKEAFEIEPTEDSLNLIVNEDTTIIKPLQIYIKNRKSGEIVYLTSDDNKLFKLEWEYFLDKGSIYDFYLKFHGKSRLNEKSILNFKELSFKKGNIDIKIYKTDNGNVSLES